MVIFFCLALFISSSLLFLVEPMFAKMVLPMLGGTPAVWNTCMLFFQMALLAGYAYTHLATSRLKPRVQVPTHLVLVLLPLICLPIGIGAGWNPPRDGNPLFWLLALLLVCVGLPFFVLSTSATVIQKWFSRTSHPSAGDPYFLYVASNAGSVVGLIGYLTVFEPHFTLAEQSRIWAYGYVILIALTTGCAIWALKLSRTRKDQARQESSVDTPATDIITVRRRLRWIALAFVPSSLMLGVTTYFTTDVASVPLLWVVPLTLYLVTFILAFSRRALTPHAAFVRILPMLVLVEMVALYGMSLPLPWIPVLHLLTFFIAAAVFHRELANDRPPARNLTEFYLLISVGGALGGVLNALIAPLLFNSIWEYPLVFALACALCPRPKPQSAEAQPSRFVLKPADLIAPLGLGVAAYLVLHGIQIWKPGLGCRLIQPGLCVVAVLCYTLVDRPLRFGLGMAAAMVAVWMTVGGASQTLLQERSFFGVLRVTESADRTRMLVHGTTIHGAQSLLPKDRREPLIYYSRTGPVGTVFGAIRNTGAARNVAVIGLGAGSLSCYAEKGQDFTFYEIDPAVERIAFDKHLFTFISDSRDRGVNVRVRLGDARLTIADAPPSGYSMIILDAFSSDSIPMHLVTKEAFRLYLSKLEPHGIIVAHISNRYLNLEPVIAGLAGECHLICMTSEVRPRSGSKWQPKWMVLARNRTDLGTLPTNPKWRPAVARPGLRVWTDDFSNIISVLKWR